MSMNQTKMHTQLKVVEIKYMLLMRKENDTEFRNISFINLLTLL